MKYIKNIFLNILNVCVYVCVDSQYYMSFALYIIAGNQNKICRGAGKRECHLGGCDSAQV